MVLKRKKDDSGAVAIASAIVISLVIFVVAALAIDMGYARSERRAAQNAADAAALAGGNVLFAADPQTPDYAAATSAAQNYAQQNFGTPSSSWAGCNDPSPLPVPAAGTSCISFELTPTVARVRVVIPEKTLQTGFANAIGVESIDVGAMARATLLRQRVSECGLCVIGRDTLHNIQNGDVTVSGADIHFNGNVSVSSQGLVATDGDITVEGTASGSMSNYDPNPETGVDPAADPLEDWPNAPNMSGLSVKTDPCGPGSTHGPGIYGSRNLRNMVCTLQPGVYVVVGTWDMAGNATTLLTGAGVTLYFACGTTSSPRACDPGEEGGTLDNSGQGTIAITAPTTGPYAGMAIWYDRHNSATLRMTGNGASGYTGTIYAPSALLLMNGNGCTNTIQALIVIERLEFNGNPSCLTSNYTAGVNVTIPPGDLHLDQ